MSTIRTALRVNYGIGSTTITFLALGNDTGTWVYRVESDAGRAYFLKLRARAAFYPATLAVPYYLQEQRMEHILAPLPTVTQALWVEVDDLVMSLYPFLEGRSGVEAGLSPRQWRAFGRLIAEVHATGLPPELLQLVPRERFVPSRRHLMPELEAASKNQALADPVARELAAFWRDQEGLIRMLVERVDSLGSQLQRTSNPVALCHGDMHPWNLLLDHDRQLWLLDWDEVVLALKERDLMFALGGIGGDGIGPEETAFFLEGYGPATIDPVALTYYQYAWAVQDIAAFGQQVFLVPELGEEARRAALRGFMSLFEPGHIVARALEPAGQGYPD